MSLAEPTPLHRSFSLLIALALALGALAPLVGPARVEAAPTELFFSEYVEGSSNNKALEIYNGTGAPVDLATYTVTMHFNGSTATGVSVGLVGTLPPGDVFVLAHASASATVLTQADQTNGAGWFNGDDAVALRKGGAVIDVVGQIGLDPGTEWGSGVTGTADNTLRRKDSVQAGDLDGSNAFDPSGEWDGFATDTFAGLGFHVVAGGEQPVVATCGDSMAVLEGSAATRTLTASDGDGSVTSIGIASITPTDPGSIALGATTPAAGGGASATAELSIGADTPAGSYSVVVTAHSDDSDPGTCTLPVNVQEVVTVGEIQGQTLDGEDGRADVSPLDGQTVFVRGVVTQRIRLATSSGATSYAFFLQDSLAAADADPSTSDGIVVFIGGFTTVLNIRPGQPAYFPEVGDQVVLQGTVDEFFNLTELTSPRFVAEEVNQGSLATMIPTTEADPPSALADAYRYWERHEGMHVTVPAGSTVTGARDVFASTHDGEVWVVRGDHAVAQRADLHGRRIFRDPHPLDDDASLTFDNGNGMRILLVSHGLKWNEASNETIIAPARVFDTVTNTLTGGTYFSFGKYAVEVSQQLELVPGTDPSLNAPPVAHDDRVEFATAPYNVENLYDFRDDPTDGCDFAGNTGCAGVSAPFDYVPTSEADYVDHLTALADQIVNDLHAPDILMIQEAEDQDICSVSDGAMACALGNSGTPNADGKPDALQDLGLTIAAAGGPIYDAAYDRDGADDRGVVSAFLYRTDRVELVPAHASHPVLGSDPAVQYVGAGLAYNSDVQNPKALNAVLPEGADVGDACDVAGVDCVFTRDPQVGLFRVWRDGIGRSAFTDVYAISNHFSSGPDSRVEQRTEQATYDAAIVGALSALDDRARIIVGGDFNVFPRPDDPFGNPDESQLKPLYDAGMRSLWEIVVADAPSSAYSYVFEGQAQTLDNQFVTQALDAELNAVRYAHVNADWPAAHGADGSRGASDHDPQVARFDLATPAAVTNLVELFVADGAIDERRAVQLLSRLDRIADLVVAGETESAADQVQAFSNHVEGLAPRWIEADAAEILQFEAEVLGSSL